MEQVVAPRTFEARSKLSATIASSPKATRDQRVPRVVVDFVGAYGSVNTFNARAPYPLLNW
jgi:hypothetical protein